MAKKYDICLDIGGTKILGVVFDEERNIVYRLKKKTKQEGDDEGNVEKVIISVAQEMIQEAGIKTRLRYDDQLKEALTKPLISF